MEGTRPSKLLLVACVVLLLQSPFVVAKKGKRTHSDKEIQDDFVNWIGNENDKYDAAQAAATESGVTRTNFATSKADVTITVGKGKADFKTLKSAINSLPDDVTTRYTIQMGPGIFKEKVMIPKGKGPITLIGAGNTKTKITYGDTAEKAGGTLKSSSVMVYSDHFICKDIAFENSAPSPAPGAVGQQAVAFMIAGDKAAFYRVTFLGAQDTLYDRAGRHYFQDCYIVGTIDFVFGDGQSYYKNCYLDCRATTFGSLSAQKRELSSETTGFSFVDCIVLGSKGYSFLGRAWGMYARTVFIRTYLPKGIRPEGWYDWGVKGRYKTVFFGEYQCYGPGAKRAGRTVWSYELTDKQVRPFLTTSWVDGKDWIPTGKQ